MKTSSILRLALLGAAIPTGCNSLLGLEVGDLAAAGGASATGTGGGTTSTSSTSSSTGTGTGDGGAGGHGGATGTGGYGGATEAGGHGGATGTGGYGGTGGSAGQAGGGGGCDDNKKKDGSETDIDCGGACPACGQGKQCLLAGDCTTGFCTDGVCCNSPCAEACHACLAALTGGADGTCDFIAAGTDPKNQCSLGNGAEVCGVGGMCRCSDGMKNGAETDLDCGGPACSKCAAGKLCDVPTDCATGFCLGLPSTCVIVPPSCAGAPLNCGNVSCCESQSLPGGKFPMGRGAVGPDAYPGGDASEQPEHTATVDAFWLDTFEVTVGRFRRFVNTFNGTPPAVGAGAHPSVPNSGWQAAWNGSLAALQATLISKLKCDPYQTWTDAPGGHETYAINCVSWFEAFAFCVWDGGRLPTEAEWELAAAGGLENRLFPWGAEDPGANKARANDNYSDASALIAVGSHPLGNGLWGHRDLAGGVWEWNLDWYDGSWYDTVSPACHECVNLTPTSTRVVRGGAWNTNAGNLRSAFRGTYAPDVHSSDVGIRCARNP